MKPPAKQQGKWFLSLHGRKAKARCPDEVFHQCVPSSCRPIGKPGLPLAVGVEISLFSTRPSIGDPPDV